MADIRLDENIRFNSTDHCDYRHIRTYIIPPISDSTKTILLLWPSGTSWKRRDKRPLSTEPKTLQRHVLTKPGGCSFPNIVQQDSNPDPRNLYKVIPNHCNMLMKSFYTSLKRCDLDTKVSRFLPGVQKTDCQTCGIRTCLFSI